MGTVESRLFAARSLLTNALGQRDLWYVVEADNWAIRAVGQSLLTELTARGKLTAALTISSRGVKAGLLHFGSLPTLFTRHGIRRPHPACRVVASIFHVASDKHRQQVVHALPVVQQWHTASQLTARELTTLGVPPHSLHVIPLGVDRTRFTPTTATAKHALRARLGIRPDAFVIGSFQKDGVGWGEGTVPKLEKGPDILVEAITAAAQTLPVHVLLAGPARGYVVKRLQAAGVPFTSVGYVPQHQALAPYYQALDAYLISARVEGGPLSLLEAWASGVPVVATRVGMVADHAEHEDTALLAETHAPSITAQLVRLAQDSTLQQRLRDQAQQAVTKFDWATIADRYYQELYQPLLATRS